MSEEEEENAFWKRQVDIMQLQSRITELEAENKELKGALYSIRDRCIKQPVIYNIITKALNDEI